MTVGEKIQYYRKKHGLSQEELGQKMLVSRQTISLWEMDKTMPTVDNLLRLKEIFSVSIDDILSENEIADEQAKEPKESYLFNYDKNDLQEVFKGLKAPLVKYFIVFIGIFIYLFLFLALEKEKGGLAGLYTGALLIGLGLFIRKIFVFHKAFKDSENRILESTYSYEVFDGYFNVNIFRNNERTKTAKIQFNEIENIQNLKNYIILQVLGQKYIIKKDRLDSNSVFFFLCENCTKKADKQKPTNKLKTLSTLLFILSICSLLGALICLAGLSQSNHMFVENTWVFYLFLPLPISSIVFGCYLKKKGYRYKKNVIVGIIMSIVLCIYGTFSVIFKDNFSHDDAPIIRAEQLLGIDIPDHLRINTQDWSKGEQSVTRGKIQMVSEIYFENHAVEEFEKNIVNDTKWLKDIPSEIIGITSSLTDFYIGDYYIVYNVDDGEYNKLPSESGTYKFINVIYGSDKNIMYLIDYQITYTINIEII